MPMSSRLLRPLPATFSEALYWIPTENEWYKAAYYKGGGTNAGYWLYATQSNSEPNPVAANAEGDGAAGSSGNFANYASGATWNGLAGNVTTVGTNGGPSAYGTFDQCGNVQEWVTRDGLPSNQAGLRGGSFGNDKFSLAAKGTLNSRPQFTFDLNDVLYAGIGFRIATRVPPSQAGNAVLVGDAGNIADTSTHTPTSGFGGVHYSYFIGTHPVTNADYAEFLNSVAADDPYGLYSPSMGSDGRGGISRSGSGSNYTYAVRPNMGTKPVNFVKWLDCCRYCNWLHNGKPSGPQTAATTEDGAYPLYGETTVVVARR